MKTKFVDKGIPIILGEYGAMRRLNFGPADAVTKHLASRAYYLKYVTKKARDNGMIPFTGKQLALVIMALLSSIVV